MDSTPDPQSPETATDPAASPSPTRTAPRREGFWFQDVLETSPPHSECPAGTYPCDKRYRTDPTITRKSLRVLAGALVAGVLSDLLLRASPAGMGLFAWVCAAIATALLVARGTGLSVSRQIWVLAVLAIVCAWGVVWRDAYMLHVLDVVFLLLCAAAIAFGARSRDLRSCGLADMFFAVARAVFYTGGGAASLVASEIDWSVPRRGPFSREGRAVVKGLLIALPLLIVFGELFASADVNFERLVKDLFSWDARDLFLHVLFTVLGTWLVAGYLRLMCTYEGGDCPRLERSESHMLGAIEVCIVLGCMNLLFLAFVVIQFPYLFGGVKHVADTAGLTMAQYARRGFFELAWVSVLVLPVLLVGHSLLRRDGPRAERAFRVLSVSLLLMLAVIMASAFQRLHIYTQSYGLTQLRFYVAAFMACLAAVFVWFALTVLRGRREFFVAGSFVIGFVTLVLLHAANPDDLIARTNAGRETTRVGVDQRYLWRLSADAVPALLRAARTTPDALLSDSLQKTAVGLVRTQPPDWRTWNLARARAGRALNESAAAPGKP